jgi:hypothetical protein
MVPSSGYVNIALLVSLYGTLASQNNEGYFQASSVILAPWILEFRDVLNSIPMEGLGIVFP